MAKHKPLHVDRGIGNKLDCKIIDTSDESISAAMSHHNRECRIELSIIVIHVRYPLCECFFFCFVFGPCLRKRFITRFAFQDSAQPLNRHLGVAKRLDGRGPRHPQRGLTQGQGVLSQADYAALPAAILEKSKEAAAGLQCNGSPISG